MDFADAVLAPFRWLVSGALLLFHVGLAAVGLPAESGWTWTLAIIGVVLALRAVLLPLFRAQVRAQEGMRELQPRLKALQDGYAGRTDPASRQALAKEQMALYKEHGTNPFAACLPLLLQAPFFLAAFQVLSGIPVAARSGAGLAALDAAQVVQFDAAAIFGAPLSASLLHGGGEAGAVVLLAVGMIVVMAACQVLAQRAVLSRALPGSALDPAGRLQRRLLFVLPLVFAVGGVYFPLGVLVYWTASNACTLAQQLVMARRA